MIITNIYSTRTISTKYHFRRCLFVSSFVGVWCFVVVVVVVAAADVADDVVVVVTDDVVVVIVVVVVVVK